jgi:hypothetical protein
MGTKQMQIGSNEDARKTQLRCKYDVKEVKMMQKENKDTQ